MSIRLANWEALLGGRHACRPFANAEGLGGNRLWTALRDGFAAVPGVTAWGAAVRCRPGEWSSPPAGGRTTR